MKHRVMLLLPLLVVGCGSETSERGNNDYASGPLPTAAAVQAEAVIENDTSQEAVVKETIISKRLTPAGAVDPEAQSEEFTPGEEIHLAVKIEPQSASVTEVRVTWYGPDDSVIAQDAQVLPNSDRALSFSSGKTTNWNPGSYRAEVWLGNHKLAEQHFALASNSENEPSTNES